QLHLIGIRLDPTIEVPGDKALRMEPDSRRCQSDGCGRSEHQHCGDRDAQPLPGANSTQHFHLFSRRCSVRPDATSRRSRSLACAQADRRGAGIPLRYKSAVRDSDDSPTLAARLQAAADAVRRMIERDLHDGAQQDLVALAVNLQLARELADSDLAAAKSLLDDLRRDVQETLDGLRSLAHGVYPSLLPLRGLVDALRTVPAH